MRINVVLAVDERLEDVKACVTSLRAVYGPDAPIALATYGGREVKDQPETIRYAKEEEIQHYDAPRQTWLTEEDSKEWHASEALARIQITKHFADIGYREIYIMHADVRVLGNFRTHFLNRIRDDCSFIAILLRAKESFESLCQKGSWALYFEDNSARLADILTAYNPEFVNELYIEYGGDQGIWNGYLSRFILWGDLAQFDIAREWHGFKGGYIQEDYDKGPMCGGTVLHVARQTIPQFISNKWIDKEGMTKNYERRAR